MQTIQEVESTLESTRDIQSVVKSMKSLAAVNIRQYLKAVNSVNSYYGTVELALEAAVKNFNLPPRITEADPFIQGSVIIGSKQGLAGQFNHKLSDYYIKQIRLDIKEEHILAIGSRIVPALEARSKIVRDMFEFPSTLEGITDLIYSVVFKVRSWIEKGAGTIRVFHNHPESGSSYSSRSFFLFPMEEKYLKELNDRKWKGRSLPFTRTDPAELIFNVLRQYFFVGLYRAFVDSLASENASRLAAMQAAEKNIEDRVAELQKIHNRLRQQAITSELLDIVAGYESVKE